MTPYVRHVWTLALSHQRLTRRDMRALRVWIRKIRGSFRLIKSLSDIEWKSWGSRP